MISVKTFIKQSHLWLVILMMAAAVLLTACERKTSAKEEKRPEISMMVPLHQTQPPADKIIEEIEMATKTDLSIEWVPFDIYTEKLIQSMRTGALKQVSFFSQTDYAAIKNDIRSSQFWEIGPYLNAYPNLKLLNESILNETAVDNKIYGLYAERPPSRQGVILRKDWLDNLNLKEPETVDELYQVLKQFTYNDPDKDGLQNTIGLSDRSDLTFGAFKTLSSYFGTPNNWTVSGSKAVPDFKTPEYMQTMDYMRKLVNENLVNSDFAVTSKQVQRFAFISGKAGVYIGSLADAPRLLDELRKLNPNAKLSAVNRISGPKGDGIWSIPSYSGVFLFSKSSIKTVDELKSILAFFDRSMDADVSNLLKYGIQGEHYVLEDGKVIRTPEMNRLRLHDTEVLPLYTLMIGSLHNTNLLSAKPESVDSLTTKVNKLIEDNEKILIRDPTQNLLSPTFDDLGDELQQIITNATYNYILGRMDAAGFRAEIEAWEKKGGSRIIQEYTDEYQKQVLTKPRP
ncbi:extracellular solute-binding protein [Paenibacillus cremeus]|uniref:Extracellular solute-binding protein n=1 Tax=Paenibacillus cremeus TaxID=2163881 RepID=A0A559JKA4_9BACL|nr:extracellular solute-binding protein [Paenibacillus cremeus]TVY00318.1 extracellular solute-binding protein [Paenibacillus cremeus]